LRFEQGSTVLRKSLAASDQLGVRGGDGVKPYTAPTVFRGRRHRRNSEVLLGVSDPGAALGNTPHCAGCR
jgi:hypothetical protein